MISMKIGKREVSVKTPAYVIAEAGVHHYNSIELAKSYILQAKIAGADAIKFQTYSADRITTKWAPAYWQGGDGLKQHDVFAQRSLFTRDQYVELFRYAEAVGIDFMSTPFDDDAAAMLGELGMVAFKIASADLLHHPMIEVAASFKRPIILSTGAAKFEEIQRTLDFLKGRSTPVSLLHCVLSYPTHLQDANLGRLSRLIERFPSVLHGLSDHTLPQETDVSCVVAVALGARVIEKHFTLNQNLPNDDHYHSLDPLTLAATVKRCRDAFEMTSKAEEILPTEEPARKYARRSIVSRVPLKAGTVIERKHLDYRRPGTGVCPADLELVLGKRLKRDLEEDALVLPADLA